MNINDLIAIVKKKLINEIKIEKIEVEDKSFLHKNHSGHQEGKFHLKLKINSKELKDLNRTRK
jgi:BolA protein